MKTLGDQILEDAIWQAKYGIYVKAFRFVLKVATAAIILKIVWNLI